jgi:hypothetical protein
MPLPTPEQIASAQAALRRRPASAVIVPAPYDNLILVTGQTVAKGTPVWKYVSGRQAGGPSEVSPTAFSGGPKPTEYSYRDLESAKKLGWKEA